MRIKSFTPVLVALAGLALSFTTANSAFVYINNDFEDGTSQGWTLNATAAVYENGDVLFNMGAADADIDWSPTGNFSIAMSRSNSEMILTIPLPLITSQADDVTISFNYNHRNNTATRRLFTDYSSDGGSTWTNLGNVNQASGFVSYELLSSNFTFTDDAVFRHRFNDGGGAAGPFFVDDVLISSTSAIPESTTALLGGLGLLALLRRRR